MGNGMLKAVFVLVMGCGLLPINSFSAARSMREQVSRLGNDQQRAQFERVIIPQLQDLIQAGRDIINATRSRNPAVANRFEGLLAGIVGPADVQRAMGESDDRMAQLTAQLQELQDANERLTAQRDRMAAELERLAAVRGQAEALQAEIQGLRARLERAQRFEAQNAELQRTNLALQAELSAMQARLRDLDGLQERLAALQAQDAQKARDLVLAKEAVARFEQQLAGLRQQHEADIATLTGMRRERDQATQGLAALQAEMAGLRQKHEVVVKRSRSADLEREQARHVQENLGKQYDELRVRCDTCQRELEECQKILRQMVERLEGHMKGLPL